jgi:hypothetical protein
MPPSRETSPTKENDNSSRRVEPVQRFQRPRHQDFTYNPPDSRRNNDISPVTPDQYDINFDALRRREVPVYVMHGFDSGQYVIRNTQNGTFHSFSICKGNSSMRFAFVNANSEIHFSNDDQASQYPQPRFRLLCRSSDARARRNPTAGWVLPDTPQSFSLNKRWACFERSQEGVAGKLPLKLELDRTTTSQNLTKQELVSFATEQMVADQAKRAINKLSEMILYGYGDTQDHQLISIAFNYFTRGQTYNIPPNCSIEAHWAQDQSMDLHVIQHITSEKKDTYVMNTPKGWASKGISENIYRGIMLNPNGITQGSYKVGCDTSGVLDPESQKIYINIENQSVNAYNDGKAAKILIDRQTNKFCITDNASNALIQKFQIAPMDVTNITSNRNPRYKYYS